MKVLNVYLGFEVIVVTYHYICLKIWNLHYLEEKSIQTSEYQAQRCSS